MTSLLRLVRMLAVCAALGLVSVPGAAAQQTGSIEGVVVNGTAGAATPANVEVVLHILTNRVKTGERRVQTDATGAFRVDDLALAADTLYFPIVQYSGVAYYPDRPISLDGSSAGRTEIAVFEVTPQPDAISFERLNMLVMNVTPTALTIMEMGAVSNASDRTFAADAQVTGSARTLRFLLPPGAIDVTPQAGLPVDTLETIPDGFASTDPVRPGRREIAFSYDLPYTASVLDLQRSFAFPVAAFTLYVPNDLEAVVPDGIAVPGVADLGGRQYRQYVVNQISPGSEVRVRLTGLPAPFFARPRDLGLAVVAGAGTILLVFLIVGVRQRSTMVPPLASVPAAQGRAMPTTAGGSERAALVRAVAVLDERFAAGQLDEAAYRAQRSESKARLLRQHGPVAGAS